MAKQAFKLPKRTISAFLHAPPNTGGLGIPCITDEIDVQSPDAVTIIEKTPPPTEPQQPNSGGNGNHDDPHRQQSTVPKAQEEANGRKAPPPCRQMPPVSYGQMGTVELSLDMPAKPNTHPEYLSSMQSSRIRGLLLSLKEAPKCPLEVFQ